MIPSNAIVVEIGPHALLQSIIKKVLSSDGTSVGLLDKYQPDNLEFFLKNIGRLDKIFFYFIDVPITIQFLTENENSMFRLYNAGLQAEVQNIFPPIQFPVSRGTPMIQSLIRWDHSVSYDVPYITDPVSIKILWIHLKFGSTELRY